MYRSPPCAEGVGRYLKHSLFSIDYEGCVDWQKGIPKPIKLELDSIKRDIANIKKNMGS
jgi:hypothetical protein